MPITQLLCADKLVKIGLVLDQRILQTNVEEVLNINVQMKAMVSKFKFQRIC